MSEKLNCLLGKKVRVTIDIINVYWDGGKNGRRAKILSFLYEREG